MVQLGGAVRLRAATRSRRARSRLLRRGRDPHYAGWIDTLADCGTWQRWPGHSVREDPLHFDERLPANLTRYREQLASLRQFDEDAEAVIIGAATIGGSPVVLIISDFAFLAGTMGVAAADRVCRAFEGALELDVPVVAVVASAGVRMQEGPIALLQMARAGAAAARFRRSGRGYFVLFAQPSMGGVLASWGGLATMSFAMPRAVLGVTGPRVVSLITGKQSAATVAETAEEWLRRGLLDDVVTIEKSRTRLATLLAVLGERARQDVALDPRSEPARPSRHPWEAVLKTRNGDYAAARWLLDGLVSDATSIRGDRQSGDDPNLHCLIGRVCGQPAVVVAHERWDDGRRARVSVAGYRKARRAIALANELQLPIVTMIDTPGPDDLGDPAASALAYEIAATTQALLAAEVPTLALLLGEGGGGAAVALLAADRVIAAADAWLAPIAPEAASAILFRTTARACELAEAQRIGADDLLTLGVVDAIVPRGSSPDDPIAAWHDAVSHALKAVRHLPEGRREQRRLARCLPASEAYVC